MTKTFAATTLAMKFPADNETASTLLAAVRTWQKQHVRGKPHPFGSCATATVTVLFDQFAEHTPNVQNRRLSSSFAPCLTLSSRVSSPRKLPIAALACQQRRLTSSLSFACIAQLSSCPSFLGSKHACALWVVNSWGHSFFAERNRPS